MSLILAGHETTASQLAWAFQLLAHNPRVQRRLIEEIDGETGDEYLTATIQEVLRHRPVFLFAIPRAVKQPIEIGGWTYAPPAHLLACIYLASPRPAGLSRAAGVSSRAVPGRSAEPADVAAVGGRSQALSGLAPGDARDEDGAANRASDMTVGPASRRMERPRWRSVIVTPHAGSRVVLRRRERAASLALAARPVLAGKRYRLRDKVAAAVLVQRLCSICRGWSLKRSRHP